MIGKSALDQKEEMVNSCNNVAVVSSLIWTIAWAMFFSIPFDCFCGGSKSAMPGTCWCDGPYTTDPKWEKDWSLMPLSVFHAFSIITVMVFWWSTMIGFALSTLIVTLPAPSIFRSACAALHAACAQQARCSTFPEKVHTLRYT